MKKIYLFDSKTMNGWGMPDGNWWERGNGQWFVRDGKIVGSRKSKDDGWCWITRVVNLPERYHLIAEIKFPNGKAGVGYGPWRDFLSTRSRKGWQRLEIDVERDYFEFRVDGEIQPVPLNKSQINPIARGDLRSDRFQLKWYGSSGEVSCRRIEIEPMEF